MALLRFQFIFYAGFFAQLMVIESQLWRPVLLLILLPISIVLSIAAPYCVRYESHVSIALITVGEYIISEFTC